MAAAARAARLLTDQQRCRFEQAAADVYNAIGPDSGWDAKTPSKATFVCVIADMMAGGAHTDLTNDERLLWCALSDRAQRAIVLSVGP